MTLITNTRFGKVQGVQENGYVAFKGIQFAKPPLGELRFLPPQDPDPWTDIRICDTYCKSAPQNPNPYVNILEEDCDEDCLYLNVYTPALDNKKRPVFFEIHGGAFQMCNHSFTCKPESITSLDCVFVTGHYRLGAFGFFQLDHLLGEEYIQSGNNGMLDIIHILKWIHENIDNFGGDPDHITVCGESAGSKMVASLLCAEKAKGLFSAAMMDSGAYQCIRTLNTARTIADKFADSMGLTKDNAKEKLLHAPWQEIIKHQGAVFSGVYLHNCGPVFDGINFDGEDAREIILSGKANYVTMLGGTAREEFSVTYAGRKEITQEMAGQYFGKNADHVMEKLGEYVDGHDKWELIHRMTNYLYGYPTVNMFDDFAKANQGNAMYEYRCDYGDDQVGANHCQTSNFAKGAIAGRYKELAKDPAFSNVSTQIVNMWNAFIKTGDPNVPELPTWPKYDSESRQIMVFDRESHTEEAPVTDPDMPTQILIF